MIADEARSSGPNTELFAVGEAAELAGDLPAARAAYEALASSLDDAIAAKAAFHLGRAAWRQGLLEDALAHYVEARRRAIVAGDVSTRASTENGVGAVHYARGEYTQARASYALALELSGDSVLRGKILLNLGVIANIEGNLDEARRLYQRSREQFARAGDEAGSALVLHNLGMLHADCAEWDEAEEAYAACLELSERLGDRQMIANVVLNRCEVLRARGARAAALAQAERAISLYAEIGDEVGRGEALRWLGTLLGDFGPQDAARAEQALLEALRIAARHHIALLHAEAARALGELLIARGDRQAAIQWLERSRDGFAGLGAERDLALVTARLAEL